MSDLDILRQIELGTGRSFTQVDADVFQEKDGKEFKNQWSYALSDQGDVICLSLGTLYDSEILALGLEELDQLNTLYLYQIEVSRFHFLTGLPELRHLRLRESYFSNW